MLFILVKMRLYTTVCICFLSWMPGSCFGQIPADVIDTWREAEALINPLSFEYQYSDGNEDLKFFCARQGDLEKSESRVTDDGEYSAAHLRNHRGFALDGKNGAWQLAKVFGADTAVPALERVSSVARIGLSVHAKLSLLEAVDDPSYEIARWSDDGETANLQLKWTAKDRWFDAASISLDPSNYYRVESITYQTEGTPDATYSMTYGLEDEVGAVLPSVWHLNGTPKEWRILTVSSEALPEAEFTLEHYGLPEYVPPGNTNYWLWAFVSGIGLVSLRWLVGKRKT